MIVALLVALIAAVPGLIALGVQQRNRRDKKIHDDKLDAASNQLGTTKEVLDNWAKIVAVQVNQISALQGQVAAIEVLERACQEERIVLLRRLSDLEHGEGAHPSQIERLAAIAASLEQYTEQLATRKAKA